MPVVPVCITEAEGRLIFRIGQVIGTTELLRSADAADLVLERIKALQ
jgi:hypothetical protein